MKKIPILILIAAVTIAFVIVTFTRVSNDDTEQVNNQIYRCLVSVVYEDGSAVPADAEDAIGCMKRAGVYDEFLADYEVGG